MALPDSKHKAYAGQATRERPPARAGAAAAITVATPRGAQATSKAPARTGPDPVPHQDPTNTPHPSFPPPVADTTPEPIRTSHEDAWKEEGRAPAHTFYM